MVLINSYIFGFISCLQPLVLLKLGFSDRHYVRGDDAEEREEMFFSGVLSLKLPQLCRAPGLFCNPHGHYKTRVRSDCILAGQEKTKVMVKIMISSGQTFLVILEIPGGSARGRFLSPGMGRILEHSPSQGRRGSTGNGM